MSKVILITGCSSGFGFDAAKQLSRSGHSVYASMRDVDGNNAEPAQHLRNLAETEGVQLRVVELDVTQDDSVDSAVSRMVADEGRVDVVINNAGLGFGGPSEAFTSEQVLLQLNVNIVGCFRVAKAVLPHMRKQESGLLIHVGSIAGRLAMPGFSIYHASKWGLEGLAEAMRYEFSPLGIDSVVVEPGPFATNFLQNIVPAGDSDVATAYGHVVEYQEQFANNLQNMFQDANAPTDPKIVVDIFEKLINTPAGERPLRTIAGLDFGAQAINDAVEPIRLGVLAEMGISHYDKVRAPE